VTRFLLDTDTISHYLRNNLAVHAAVVAHRQHVIELPIIAIEEIWDCWTTMVRRAKTDTDRGRAYDRLTNSLNELRRWAVQSFTTSALNQYSVLKSLKLNVRANDMKIAAIALECEAVVVTANTRDFERIPGLKIVDWTLRFP